MAKRFSNKQLTDVRKNRQYLKDCQTEVRLKDGNTVLSACKYKVQFSRSEARTQAEKLGMRYYKCPFCRKYHLTSCNAPIKNPISKLIHAIFKIWV